MKKYFRSLADTLITLSKVIIMSLASACVVIIVLFLIQQAIKHMFSLDDIKSTCITLGIIFTVCILGIAKETM